MEYKKEKIHSISNNPPSTLRNNTLLKKLSPINKNKASMKKEHNQHNVN